MAQRGRQVSEATKNEAMQIAKGTQKPGQTKEQTKLIAQGIQKGIEQYKKTYKQKSRELDKKSKRAINAAEKREAEVVVETTVERRQSPLPWVLLVLSWLGFAAYVVLLK